MTERFSLKGQVAVVTGASRGLGFEMARAVAESGARVYMTARGQDQLEQSAATLRDGGSRRPHQRVRSRATAMNASRAIREIGEAEGRLDILVNNAGINAWEPLAEAKTSTWDRVIAHECPRPLSAVPRGGALHGAEGLWPHRQCRLRPRRRRDAKRSPPTCRASTAWPE